MVDEVVGRCPAGKHRGPGDLCYPKADAAYLARLRKDIVGQKKLRRKARRGVGEIERRLKGRMPTVVKRSLERGLDAPSTPSIQHRYSYRRLRGMYEGKRTVPTGMKPKREVYRRVRILKHKQGSMPPAKRYRTLYRYRLSPKA